MLTSKAIAGFEIDCKSRNLSQGTIETCYIPLLNQLCDFLNDPDVNTITITDLREFIVHNKNRNIYSVGNNPFASEQDKTISPYTLGRYVRVAKTFFKWAYSEGIIDHNPSERLQSPKLPKGRIEVFSQEEINILLEKAQETSYRDYCIVLMLLDSGLRKNELLCLTLDDISLTTGMVTVRHGKGDKDRQIKVGNHCRKALWRYLNDFRPESDSQTFFLSRNGKPLAYHALGTIMNRLSKKCGFKVYCHKFRHTYGTSIAKKFPNSFLISQVLGHSTLEMSKKYIHFVESDVRNVLSPMDDLLKS